MLPLESTFCFEAEDLSTVQEQLARPRWLMGCRCCPARRAGCAFREATPPQSEMRANCLLEGDPAGPERLYFRAGQDEAGLDALQNVVVESGAPIVRDKPIASRGVRVGRLLCAISTSL